MKELHYALYTRGRWGEVGGGGRVELEGTDLTFRRVVCYACLKIGNFLYPGCPKKGKALNT